MSNRVSESAMAQDLYFEVCRKKSHIFLEAKESHKVSDLKLMLEGIIKIDPKNLELTRFDDDGNKSLLQNNQTLQVAGYSCSNAKAQCPAVLGLRVLGEDDELVINDVTAPPPIPETLRQEQPPAEN